MTTLKRLALPYLGSVIFAMLTWGALSIMIYALNGKGITAILYPVSATITFWLMFRFFNTREPNMTKLYYALTILASAMLIIWVVPAFILYVSFNPGSYKRAIQISVILLSTGVGIAYFIANRNKFPSVADKVTYFSGVCLGPATVVSLVL